MPALTDVLHFLTHKFTGLSASCLPLAFILAGPLDRLLLRHVDLQCSGMLCKRL